MADGSTDISIDDPDFWQKWAEKAKLDLEQLANKVAPLSSHIPILLVTPSPFLPPPLTSSQDSLVIDTPRQRRQVRRYGNESLQEIVDMSEVAEEVMDVLPSRGRYGWTRLECFKVEKGLLTFG